jgi:hypothetical protein
MKNMRQMMELKKPVSEAAFVQSNLSAVAAEETTEAAAAAAAAAVVAVAVAAAAVAAAAVLVVVVVADNDAVLNYLDEDAMLLLQLVE